MAAWVLHVDLDQFIAAVEVLRRPELRRAAGGRGRPRRPDRARCGLDRVVRGARVRRALGHAAAAGASASARTRCSCRSTRPPTRRRRSRSWRRCGRSDVVVEVMGWDEAFLGVEADDPVALAAESGAPCSPRPGCPARSASATTSCAPSSPPGSASRRGMLPADRGELVRGDGRAADRRAVGHRRARPPSKLAALGIHTVRELAAADTAVLAARSARRWARGTGGSVAGSTTREVDRHPVRSARSAAAR